MPNVKDLSVKIRIDKEFGKLVDRACKALKSLGADGLITTEEVDTIVDRILIQLKNFIIVGKVK